MMQNNPPLLSIVLPTFNRLELLQETLPAALRQASQSDAELIVVDDSSTDGTWAWLLNRRASLGQRITCLRAERNMGPGPARNLGVASAAGRFFLPLDSDCMLMEEALQTISRVLQKHADDFRAFFFPCIELPSQRRMDSLQGDRILNYEDLLYGRSGIRELIPVISTEFLRSRQLAYPEFRCGGESLLWITLLKLAPALFVDQPIVWYRTDSPNRLCAADAQLKASREMAKIADALVAQFPEQLHAESRRAKARRLMAAGAYYGLAGDLTTARRRFRAALSLGRLSALGPWAISLLGQPALRHVFSLYRSKSISGAAPIAVPTR